MTWLDMVRVAVRELGGSAPPDRIAGFVEERFGQPISPRFIPFHLATLRGEEELRRARERAAQIRAEEAAAAEPGRQKRKSQAR